MAESEISLVVVAPGGDGQCYEYKVQARLDDRGGKLKERIEKVCGVSPDDQELFAQGSEEAGTKQRWIAEEQTLAEQQILDGSVVTVAVHGTSGGGQGRVADGEDGEELPDGAVERSLYTKGDTSYYFAHPRASDLPEEHRIVSGGAPQKISESAAQHMVPPEESTRLFLDDDEDDQAASRPERRIMNYSWGDEREAVKIYVSTDREPEAVSAAGDGKEGQVEVKWGPKYLKLTVHGPAKDWVLVLDRIYYEVVPEECRWRVSAGKRITLTLKKKETMAWMKLLKPEM